MSSQAKKRFILTGPSGIGKTTIVKSVCSALQQNNIPIQGFYTEELRTDGQRIGFDVISFNGQREALARVDDDAHNHKYRVGKYSVLLDKFESVALPIFNEIRKNSNSLVIVDEIGKMEMFSNKFVSEIQQLFKIEANILLATIPIAKGKPLALVEFIRSHPTCEIIDVDMSNRNQIPEKLLDSIVTLYNNQHCKS